MAPESASTATKFNPQRSKILPVGRVVQVKAPVETGLVDVEGIASFIMNCRTRSSPAFGRGSSRNLV